MPALPPDRPEGRPADRRQASGRPGRRHARPGCPAPGRPLPDPAVVQMFLVPESAPPYDDAADAAAPGLASGSDGPADTATAAAGDRAQAPGERERAGRPSGGPPGADPRPEVPRWPGQFAQVLVETLAGARPARQIAPWATEQVRERIARLGPRLAAGHRPRVLRVITARPTPMAVEMTILVRVGPRVRALAVRLERDSPEPAVPGHSTPAGWRCTAVEAA